jgi:PAS domain S-box-containing protein
MSLALLLFIGGVVILLWLLLWSRQKQRVGNIPTAVDAVLRDMPLVSTNDAVLVATPHGQILYANQTARRWLDLEGDPDLEYIAVTAKPSDSFLELFVRDMQASFQLGERWVEASSHSIPAGGETRTVVVLRELTASTAHPEALDLSKAMNVVNEIGETINASLGVEQALQALLTIVQKVVPADAGEICLWSEERRALNPRGWVGEVGYVLALAEAGGMYAEGEGISGWIAQHRKPVLVNDKNEDFAVRPKLADTAYQSFVAVPLMLGERFIGTFELASEQPGRFTHSDLALLQAVSKPVAISIFNAELYTEQSRRIEDLATLQEVRGEREEDADAIFASLTERVARLLGADMCGILVFDERKQALVAQPPFYGLPVQVVRSYAIPVPEGSTPRSIWARHPHWFSNDLADEPLAEEMRLTLLINAAGMYNVILMPLQVGSRRIGMIQVSNKRTHGGFTMSDVQTLRLLASQVAVIVEDVRLVQQEQRRDTEMIGLQEITQAFGALAYEEEFFASTNERIARLMGVGVCGILLYDESSNRLVAQPPFYGLSDQAIAPYTITLEANSPMEQIWDEEDYWYTNAAQTDKVIVGAGLAERTTALGIQRTLLASLSSGGRKLGVVQLADKVNGEDFTDKDARLMLIFAAQVAGMIENSRLFREAQRRADEAESVRRVAELAGQVSTTDDSMQPAMAEVARLLNSPISYFNLLDSQTGNLVVYPRHVYGAEIPEPLIYDAYSKGFEYSVAVSKRPFWSNDTPNDKRVLPVYRDNIVRLDIRCTVLVPLVVGEQSLGELGVMNRPDCSYNEEDVRLLSAIAIQIAAALDRIRLYEATGQNLSRRLLELDAISRVSNELAQTLDFESVLDVIRHEAVRATDADGNTIALLAPPSEWGESDQPQLDRRLGERRPPVGLADVEQAAVRRLEDAVIVEDYAVRNGSSAMQPVPEDARSAIAASFSHEDRVIGVIHLYHRQPNHFDSRAATFLLTLAAKASLSYGNNLRYLENRDRSERLHRRVEQLNQIFELGQMLQNNVDPATMLEAIAYSVQQSGGFDIVVMTLANGGVLSRITQAGLPLDVFEKSKDKTLQMEQLQELFAKEDFRISESYFLPFEKLSQWYVDGLEVFATQFSGMRTMHPRGRTDWRDGDMMLVPMFGAGGEILGVMTLDRPFNGQRPDRSTIEILEIFAHQAASTIENTRLYMATVRSAEQEARLNEVMEAIASTLDINQIVEGVARGALRMLPFMRMTITLLDSEQQGFDIIRVTVKPDSSFVIGRERRPTLEGTALGRTFEEGQDYLYHANDGFVQQYEDLRSLYAEGERTSLLIPLITGGLCLGAMHLGSDATDAFGFEEHRALLKRIANLSAVAVQNARLFNQAVNLRLFNESVFQSIQQGILVLDRNLRILTINDYMRRHFGWGDDAVGQALFTYRPALEALLEPTTTNILDTGAPQELLGQPVLDGTSVTMQDFYLYPLLSADSVRGMVVLVDDVTKRIRLEEDVAKRAEQLAALTEVSSRITAALRRDEVINLALDEMKRVIGYDVAVLWRREGASLMMEAARGVDMSDTPVPISEHDRLHRIVELHHAVTISRLHKDSLPGGLRNRSWLGVPLMQHNSVIGMVTLGSYQPDFYTDQSEQAVQAFANQMAVALVNADLFEDAHTRTQRLSLLNRVSLSLAQSLDTENILEVALREIASTLDIERARAYMFERDTSVARIVVEHPRGDFPPSELFEILNNPGLRSIWRTPEPVVVTDVSSPNVEVDDELRSELVERGITAYALLPMAVGGQTSGAFEMEFFDGPREFENEKLDLALIIANQAAIAVLNANLLEQTLVRTRELETLLEAAQATSITLDLQDVFHSVVRLTCQALDMDDCAIMMYDYVEEILMVELDVNRNGDETRITPHGTKFDLFLYPSKTRALREGSIIVIRRDDPSMTDRKELEELRQTGDYARMLVPLVVRDQAIGLLQVDLQSPLRSFTHREIRMAQALGAQAATAIENARLSTETSAQVEQSLIINDLGRAISATMDIPSMIATVRQQIASLTTAGEMYLALYSAATGEVNFPMALSHGQDFEIPPRPLGGDEVSFVIRNRRPLLLGGDNPSADEVRRNLNLENGEGDSLRYLGVPLIAGDQVVGVLAIRDSDQTRPFGLNDQRILTTIGTQLGAAIQNANLFERISNFADELNQRVQERTMELQQERDRLDALYRITAELGRTLDMDRVLDRALDMVTKAIGADEGVVMLIDPVSDQLYSRAVLSAQRPTVNGNNRDKHHPAEMLGTWLLAYDRVAMVHDLRDAEYWDDSSAGAAEWRGALGVVLETGEDVQGVMVFLSHRPGIFAEAQLKLVTAAANQVSAAINNADLYNLIRDQAERMSTLLRAEQEGAEKNSAILEGIADGVVLADASGVIVLFNGAAERILDIRRDYVLGQPLARISSVRGSTQWVQALEDWMHSPQHRQTDELILDRLDLGRNIVSIHASPVFIGDQLLGTVSVFRDVTKEVEVDRMKSEFISNVSHELRTPMTSIKGYADLLLMGAAGEVGDQQQHFLQTIKANADRLSHLVNDLLNISKIDAGTERMKFEPVDAGEVINETVTSLRGRADFERKQITVTTRIDPMLPPIVADRARVGQILQNLIDNAFNYTYPGGSIDVEARLESEKPDHVLISLKDTGIGIPEEFRPRIWNRFERYDDHALVMEVAGTGLGLSIVKHLVEIHQGDIWFESEENKGTTFYVSLPVHGPDGAVPDEALSGGRQQPVEG